MYSELAHVAHVVHILSLRPNGRFVKVQTRVQSHPQHLR
jgi:hypothetical protein